MKNASKLLLVLLLSFMSINAVFAVQDLPPPVGLTCEDCQNDPDVAQQFPAECEALGCNVVPIDRSIYILMAIGLSFAVFVISKKIRPKKA